MPNIISDLMKSLQEVISAGREENADQRQKIRDIVGELGDQLNRAFLLVDIYLDGAKPIRDRHQLAAYLWSAHEKLRASFNDYQVCSGIRQLADEWKQVFDTTRYAVAIGQADRLYALIEALEFGEGMVLDDLDDTRLKCSQFADKIDSMADDEFPAARKELFQFIQEARDHYSDRRNEINETIATIIKQM